MSKLYQLYNINPDMFNDSQVDVLQKQAESIGMKWDRKYTDSGLRGIATNLVAGFAEGFTTLNLLGIDHPTGTASQIARSVGHLVGFIGPMPTGMILKGVGAAGKSMKYFGASKGLAAAVEKRGLSALVGKTAAEKLPYMEKAHLPFYMTGVSVPMLASRYAGDIATKIITKPLLSEVKWAAKVADKMPAAMVALRHAFHLGTASAVSDWQSGVDEMMKSFTWGSIAGALFSGTASTAKKFIPDVKSQMAVRTLAGAMMQGGLATHQDAPTAIQVYQYLLGAFFGYKAQPWDIELAGRHMAGLSREQIQKVAVDPREADRMYNELPEGNENKGVWKTLHPHVKSAIIERARDKAWGEGEVAELMKEAMKRITEETGRPADFKEAQATLTAIHMEREMRKSEAVSRQMELGGYAPKGWRNDQGKDGIPQDLRGVLTEHSSSSYPDRTKANVDATRDSGATILFYPGGQSGIEKIRKGSGTKLTLNQAQAVENQLNEVRTKRDQKAVKKHFTFDLKSGEPKAIEDEALRFVDFIHDYQERTGSFPHTLNFAGPGGKKLRENNWQHLPDRARAILDAVDAADPSIFGTKVKKIISGAQTGMDEMGLRWGLERNAKMVEMGAAPVDKGVINTLYDVILARRGYLEEPVLEHGEKAQTTRQSLEPIVGRMEQELGKVQEGTQKPLESTVEGKVVSEVIPETEAAREAQKRILTEYHTKKRELQYESFVKHQQEEAAKLSASTKKVIKAAKKGKRTFLEPFSIGGTLFESPNTTSVGDFNPKTKKYKVIQHYDSLSAEMDGVSVKRQEAQYTEWNKEISEGKHTEYMTEKQLVARATNWLKRVTISERKKILDHIQGDVESTLNQVDFWKHHIALMKQEQGNPLARLLNVVEEGEQVLKMLGIEPNELRSTYKLSRGELKSLKGSQGATEGWGWISPEKLKTGEFSTYKPDAYLFIDPSGKKNQVFVRYAFTDPAHRRKGAFASLVDAIRQEYPTKDTVFGLIDNPATLEFFRKMPGAKLETGKEVPSFKKGKDFDTKAFAKWQDEVGANVILPALGEKIFIKPKPTDSRSFRDEFYDRISEAGKAKSVLGEEDIRAWLKDSHKMELTDEEIPVVRRALKAANDVVIPEMIYSRVKGKLLSSESKDATSDAEMRGSPNPLQLVADKYSRDDKPSVVVVKKLRVQDDSYEAEPHWTVDKDFSDKIGDWGERERFEEISSAAEAEGYFVWGGKHAKDEVWLVKKLTDEIEAYKPALEEVLKEYKSDVPEIDTGFVNSVLYDVLLNGGTLEPQSVAKTLRMMFDNPKKFILYPAAQVKRNQLILNSGFPGTPGVYEARHGTRNMSMVFMNDLNDGFKGREHLELVRTPGKHESIRVKEFEEFIDASLTETVSKPGQESTDGAMLVLREWFESHIIDGAMPLDAAFGKAHYVHTGAPEGMLLQKMGIFIVPEKFAPLLRDKGITHLSYLSGTKQLGNRPSHSMRLEWNDTKNDWELKFYDENNSFTDSPVITEVDTESFRWARSTYDTLKDGLDDAHLVRQMLVHLVEDRVHPAVVKDFFERYTKAFFKGDAEQNDVVNRWYAGEEADLSKVDVTKLGLEQKLWILEKDNGEAFGRIVEDVMKISELPDPSEIELDDPADRDFYRREMRVGEGVARYMIERFGTGPEVVREKYVWPQFEHMLKRYIMQHVSSPDIPNSGKSYMLPADMFTQAEVWEKNRDHAIKKRTSGEAIKPGEVWFSGGLKDKVIDTQLSKDVFAWINREAKDLKPRNSTLGEMWNIYEGLHEARKGKQGLSEPAQELYGQLTQKFNNFYVIRVPADSIPGGRGLKFRGFLDRKGNGVLLSDFEKRMLGGADNDGDSVFWYLDLPKNYMEAVKKNESLWLKDNKLIGDRVGESFWNLGQNPALEETPKNYGLKYSPLTRYQVGRSSAMGNKMLASYAVAKQYIGSYISWLRKQPDSKFTYDVEGFGKVTISPKSEDPLHYELPIATGLRFSADAIPGMPGDRGEVRMRLWDNAFNYEIMNSRNKPVTMSLEKLGSKWLDQIMFETTDYGSLTKFRHALFARKGHDGRRIDLYDLESAAGKLKESPMEGYFAEMAKRLSGLKLALHPAQSISRDGYAAEFKRIMIEWDDILKKAGTDSAGKWALETWQNSLGREFKMGTSALTGTPKKQGYFEFFDEVTAMLKPGESFVEKIINDKDIFHRFHTLFTTRNEKGVETRFPMTKTMRDWKGEEYERPINDTEKRTEVYRYLTRMRHFVDNDFADAYSASEIFGALHSAYQRFDAMKVSQSNRHLFEMYLTEIFQHVGGTYGDKAAKVNTKLVLESLPEKFDSWMENVKSLGFTSEVDQRLMRRIFDMGILNSLHTKKKGITDYLREIQRKFPELTEEEAHARAARAAYRTGLNIYGFYMGGREAKSPVLTNYFNFRKEMIKRFAKADKLAPLTEREAERLESTQAAMLFMANPKVPKLKYRLDQEYKLPERSDAEPLLTRVMDLLRKEPRLAENIENIFSWTTAFRDRVGVQIENASKMDLERFLRFWEDIGSPPFMERILNWVEGRNPGLAKGRPLRMLDDMRMPYRLAMEHYRHEWNNKKRMWFVKRIDPETGEERPVKVIGKAPYSSMENMVDIGLKANHRIAGETTELLAGLDKSLGRYHWDKDKKQGVMYYEKLHEAVIRHRNMLNPKYENTVNVKREWNEIKGWWEKARHDKHTIPGQLSKWTSQQVFDAMDRDMTNFWTKMATKMILGEHGLPRHAKYQGLYDIPGGIKWMRKIMYGTELEKVGDLAFARYMVQDVVMKEMGIKTIDDPKTAGIVLDRVNSLLPKAPGIQNPKYYVPSIRPAGEDMTKLVEAKIEQKYQEALKRGEKMSKEEQLTVGLEAREEFIGQTVPDIGESEPFVNYALMPMKVKAGQAERVSYPRGRHSLRAGDERSLGTRTDTGIYKSYISNMMRAYYNKVQLILGRNAIDQFYENKGMGEYTDEWAAWLRVKLAQNVGYPTIFTEEIINTKAKHFKHGPLAMLSDQNIGNWIKKVRKKYRLPEDVLESIDTTTQAGRDKLSRLERSKDMEIYAKLRSWSNLEAKWSLITMLSNFRTVTGNLLGGTQHTIIQTGFRHWRLAGDPAHVASIMNLNNRPGEEEIKPEWNSIEKELFRQGLMEEFLVEELRLDPAFKYEQFPELTKAIVNIVKKNPDISPEGFKAKVNSTYQGMKTEARRFGITDAVVDKAAWFMRWPERRLRRRAYLAMYLKLRDTMEGYEFARDDPWLVNNSHRGVRASQFLYNAASRPAFAATSMGRMLTRFQLFGWNSVHMRNEIVREARLAGYEPGSDEYNRLKRLMLNDVFMLTLATALPASIFESALPPPLSWAQDTAAWLFGDEDERDRAFFGTYPWQIAPLQAFPVTGAPITRYFTGLMTLPDFEEFSRYQMYTWFPFGRLIRGAVGASMKDGKIVYNGALRYPTMIPEKMFGIPVHGIHRYVDEIASQDEAEPLATAIDQNYKYFGLTPPYQFE